MCVSKRNKWVFIENNTIPGKNVDVHKCHIIHCLNVPEPERNRFLFLALKKKQMFSLHQLFVKTLMFLFNQGQVSVCFYYGLCDTSKYSKKCRSYVQITKWSQQQPSIHAEDLVQRGSLCLFLRKTNGRSLQRPPVSSQASSFMRGGECQL